MKAHNKDLGRMLDVLDRHQTALQAYMGNPLCEEGGVRGPCGWSWATQADA